MTLPVRIDFFKAVQTLLGADSTMKNLLTDPVVFYDTKAKNRAALPYIVMNARLGQWDTVATETGDGYGAEMNLDILIFTNSRGSSLNATIGQRIKELLRDTESLVMANHHLVMIRFMFEGNFDDQDDNAETDQMLSYGVLQFRALIEEV